MSLATRLGRLERVTISTRPRFVWCEAGQAPEAALAAAYSEGIRGRVHVIGWQGVPTLERQAP